MYKVMWVNEIGQGEMNQDGFDTERDAEEYCTDLRESFTDEQYYVTDYVQREFPSNNGGISKGVDGWEDMFNY